MDFILLTDDEGDKVVIRKGYIVAVYNTEDKYTTVRTVDGTTFSGIMETPDVIMGWLNDGLTTS